MPPVLLVMRLHIFDYSLIPKREPKPFQPTLDLPCYRNPSQISLEPHWSPSLDHSLRGCNCYNKSFQNHKYPSWKLRTTSKTIFCHCFYPLSFGGSILIGVQLYKPWNGSGFTCSSKMDHITLCERPFKNLYQNMVSKVAWIFVLGLWCHWKDVIALYQMWGTHSYIILPDFTT